MSTYKEVMFFGKLSYLPMKANTTFLDLMVMVKFGSVKMKK